MEEQQAIRFLSSNSDRWPMGRQWKIGTFVDLDSGAFAIWHRENNAHGMRFAGMHSADAVPQIDPEFPSGPPGVIVCRNGAGSVIFASADSRSAVASI
jgi:hypothetical protein